MTAVVDAGRLGRRGDLATLQGVLRFVFVADLISTLVVAGRAGRALQFART